MTIHKLPKNASAAVIARFLKERGIKRVYALCGGHIMPLWMQIDAVGIDIIDVRDERAAVYMAHAEAQLTGNFGVAMVTAGPGMTNAITGIANAHTSRIPVLVLSGLPPRSQENKGALQDMPHAELVRPITRYARTVRQPELVLQELDEAVSRAQGHGGEPGPVYLDFPVDTQRGEIPEPLLLPEHFAPKPYPRTAPTDESVKAAVDLLWSAKRPLFITGRGANGAGAPLAKLLSKLGAAYLDTGESKGLIPDDHPSVIAAMRGQVMTQSDLVVTIGRKLDFQLAYGSPAIFGDAKLLRISNTASELRDNRRGTVELLCDPALAIEAILKAGEAREPATDTAWLAGLKEKHNERSEKLIRTLHEAEPGPDGLMHPNKLVAALRDAIPDDSVVVADGGDFLSFARVGLPAKTYLDPGSLGCIGVGTPFGIAASLACPDKTVVVATGDGSFGFNAMEIDTAVRHKAPVMIAIANNGSWAIEVRDQKETHGKVIGTHLQFADYAAMGRAFGLHAERVEKAEDLPAAIERAMANRPSLLDVLVTPEAVSSDAKSGLAWVPNLQALAAWNDAEEKWRKG